MKDILLVANGLMGSLSRGRGVDRSIVELGGGLGGGGFLPLEVCFTFGVTFRTTPRGN